MNIKNKFLFIKLNIIAVIVFTLFFGLVKQSNAGSGWTYEGVAYYAYSTSQVNTVPIYRFWSKKNQGHFYTASEEEKNLVINKYSDDVWHYEGIAYYAYPTPQPNSMPVYRFWSKKNQHHFYTASETEKNLVINKYDDYIWKYEGIAWYVTH